MELCLFQTFKYVITTDSKSLCFQSNQINYMLSIWKENASYPVFCKAQSRFSSNIELIVLHLILLVINIMRSWVNHHILSFSKQRDTSLQRAG